jgi:hypothetical protein
MSDFSQALAALAEAANEPLNWLLGDFLRDQAKAATGSPHFLLRLLESPKGVDRVPHNVIALHWEVPDPLVDSDAPDIIGKEVETLFSNFGIQLKIVMFWQEPEVPLHVLKGI